MVSASNASSPSAGKASLAGTAVGTGFVVLYLVAGLLFGSWKVGEFLAHLTVETVGSLVLVGGMAIAVFAVPITLFLHSRIIGPSVLLGVIVIGWPVYGFLAGIVGSESIFGLGLYAIGLSPLYAALNLLLGGGEYYLRWR